MHIVNLYSVLVVCLFGIVCSSWFNKPAASASAASTAVNNKGINYEDDYYNVAQKDLTSSFFSSGGAIRKRRYILDVRSFGKTCLLEYENVCETADYSIHVKNGISGHDIKATLIQKESSDLVSVHNLMDTFSEDGSVQFIFKSIPSLHYSVVLEMSDLINNADYDIGNNCHCQGCSDNTRVIDLSEMENRITHTVRSDKKNKITFPQKTFVHGNFLFSKFLYFHSELNTKTIENYTQLYSFYNELVYPCSGTIMTHSVNYNIHYDMSTVHCYHVHMVDKFIKKIQSTIGDDRSSGSSTLNFMSNSNSDPILIKLEDRLSNDKLVNISGKNYRIPLPLKYKDGGYYSFRGSVVGRMVTIYTRNVFFQKKYIYKNNVNNRMEYVHMFRILFNLFKELYNVSYEDMLLYTTGLTMKQEGFTSSSHVDQEYNIYAEELAILLNSLAFEFSAEAVGLNREVLVKEESQFVSKYGSNHFAQVEKNQLVLRSSTEICLVVLESIARELSRFINLQLKKEYRNSCNTMRQGHSYANVSPMYHTYELDCNLSILYLEYNLPEDVMVKRLITNKTLFEEVKLELFYINIFGYTVYLHVQVDDKFVRSLKKRVPKYVNGSTVVTMTVMGRRTDASDTSDVMVILKEISFPMQCRENCTSKHPIVVEDNLDYITVGDICVQNEGLPKVCFPAYSFGYVFDTRLLRVHMISINPYPEILLTPFVQRSIVEGHFCILTPTPGETFLKVSVPSVYEDTVCKEYINRCSLITTKFVLNDAGSMPGSAVAALRRNQFRVHLSTHFDEKHEEMLQVVYRSRGSGQVSVGASDQVSSGVSGGVGGGEMSFILTHYNDSFYINGRSNKMQWSRAKESFSKRGSPGGKALHDHGSGADEGDDDDEEDEDAYYKGVSQIDTKTHRVHVVDNKRMVLTHMQTPKQNDATRYHPFGEISINYQKIRPNMYMKFLNNYMYFYEGAEKYNEEETSPHFVNVSPYQYECLGAYAYLMNKFNILVNDSLNCDAIQMIIEVLLKANLGKYFIHLKDKKIHLNFFKKHEDSHDVFDLVHMEIYESHAPLKPIKTYKLNVSIDENNLNLLHQHRNVEYPNKYFSNVYILLFKAAYLSNGYDFYTFFYEFTGILLIDSVVVENMDKLLPEEREAVRVTQSVLKDQFEISLERHTMGYDLLINEISLLAAYITELTSSYRKVSQRGSDWGVGQQQGGEQSGAVSGAVSEAASKASAAPLAGIKYFVYVDEFKHKSEKKITANEMAYHLAKHGVLMIRKKSLCCSNFVDEVENSLYYHLLYRYVLAGHKFEQGAEEEAVLHNVEAFSSSPAGGATIGHSIVQRLLGQEVSASAVNASWSESDVEYVKYVQYVEYVANWIMGESGYISRKDGAAQSAIHVNLLDCLNMDLQRHDESVITEFASEFDQHGALVSITMEKWAVLGAEAATPASAGEGELDQYAVYFLFRNLAVPFVGETNRTETLELRRVLLLKGNAPHAATDSSVVFKVYIDNVNSNSIFMLEKVIFVSKEGNQLVKEINVEYQTFFVHPYSMVLNTEIRNAHIGVAQVYYDKMLECHHYYNGLQVCNNPKFDYEGFSPYYVSYLENNQRKDILFKSKEEVANMINNGYLSLSKRFQLDMGGDVMTADIYRTVRLIVEEVAYSVGIHNLGEKSCGTLYLNRGQLHVPNDGKSLISNIFYDTNYCIDKGAVLKEILQICNFEKKDLVKLFDYLHSNVLPYQLNEKFADSLTREEMLSLIYYFLSVPPQVNKLIKKNSIYLEIGEMSVQTNKDSPQASGGEEQSFAAVVVVVDPSVSSSDSLLISKRMLSPKRLNEESIIQFNVALYTELLKNLRQLREKSGQKVDDPTDVLTDIPPHMEGGSGMYDRKKVIHEVKSYVQNSRTCSVNGRSDGGSALSLTPPQFSNAGPMFKPDGFLTYNVPSFTYTDEAIYVKEQPDIHSAFNNLFLYEGQSTADGKYLSAIVVLSAHRFLSLENVTYVGLIANTFDDTNQFVLKCYPHKKYDTSKFASKFNLEPNTVYLVCRNVAVKYLRNGLYEFNKYVVEYDTDSNGTVGTHIYESLPIRPVYEVCNDPKVVVPKAENVSIEVKLVQSSSSTSATKAEMVEYQIEVNGLVELHIDPYAVVKPIFTHSSYLYNTIIYTTDDFVSYTYPRKLKHWEFLRLPFSKGLFKNNTLTLRTLHRNKERGMEDRSKVHCVYSLVMVKSFTLMKVIIKDLYGNEYEVKLDGEEQPQTSAIGGAAVTPVEAKPGKEETKPAEEVTKPAEEVTKPAEEVTKPCKEVTKPCKEETKPCKEVIKPAEEKTKPSPSASPAPSPAQSSKKVCTSFLLSIQSKSSVGDDDATSLEEAFFLVHSSCIVREGVISLRVAEDRETYTTDAEEKHLMNRDTFDEIYKMICEQIKLQKGNYSVKISSSAQKEVIPDKKLSVQRVHEDGSDYYNRGLYNLWEKGFSVDLFGKKGQQAVAVPRIEASKAEVPKVETPKVEAPKVEAPKVEAPKEELVQVWYDRRVDYLISIKRTDAPKDDKEKAYEENYTLLTGTLNSSVTSVVVKDGKLSATCLEGDCILKNTFLEDMMNVKNLKNGTYELDIKKRIHLTKSDDSDRGDAPSAQAAAEVGAELAGSAAVPPTSSSSLRGGSTRNGGTFVCIVENMFSTLSGGMKFRKVVHVQGEEQLSSKEGTYDVFITKGKYLVKNGSSSSSSSATAKDSEVIKRCINKAWKVKDNTDYKFGVQLTTSVANAAKVGDARLALLSDEEKEYYLVVNKLGKNGMPLYTKNRIVHFIGKKGLADGKYIVKVNGDKYVSEALSVTSDGAETTVSTTPLGKAADRDDNFFQDLFKMLYKKPSNGSYYVEFSNSEIVDVNEGILFTDQIVLTEPAATSPHDGKDAQNEEVEGQDSIVKAYLVEVVSDTEEDEEIAEYEEVYILHGYTLKGGQFHIEYNNGVCTMKSIVRGNESTRSSDIEKMVKISGRKMNNGGYFVHVNELFMDEQGEYFDNPYAPLWKNKKDQSGVGHQGGFISQEISEGGALIDDAFWKHVMQNVTVREFHKGSMKQWITAHGQSGPKGEEGEDGEEGEVERPFYAYVHLDNDGQGNSCKFRKVLQGWGTGLQKGKYYVQVMNGSYFPTTVYGPKVNNEYLKMLIENAWDYPYRTILGFYVDIHPGDAQGEQTMEKTLEAGEAYYSVIIRQLNGEKRNTGVGATRQGQLKGEIQGELIKIAGRDVPTGEYFIEVTDERGTATGIDASGKKMDEPFLKNVVLLLYDMKKRGKYHVVITKDVRVTKTEQEAAPEAAVAAAGSTRPVGSATPAGASNTPAVEKKLLNKTLEVTKLNLVDGSEILQKVRTIIKGIKVHPDRNIPDGSYGMNVYTNGMIQIRAMYMGNSLGPLEEAELKRVLPSPPPTGLSSGLYLVQVKSNVKQEIGSRRNFREGRDTSSSGSSSSGFPSCTSTPAGKKTSMTITNGDGSVVYYDNQPHAMGRIPLPLVNGDRTMTHYQKGNCQKNVKVTHCTSSTPSNCRNVFKARRVGE